MGESLDLLKMPFSMEAERAVLGSVLIDPACISKVQMAVSSRDFYLPQHQAIFGGMEMLARRNLLIDPLTVLDRLKEDDLYDETGGRNYLWQMAQAVPSTANVESYAKIVRRKATARAAIIKAHEIANALSSESEEFNIVGEWAGELLQLLSGHSQQKVFRFSQLIAAFPERMNQPVDFISTGFARLDKHVMLERGDYVIVGGRPSSGKTAFTLQMMLEMAKLHRVAYFSLETNPEKLFDRSASNRSGVELRSIKRRELDYEDKTAIAESLDEYIDRELYLVAAAGWTADQVRACAQQLQSEVIFVDYLGLITHSSKDLYQKVTGISIALRTLAETTGITVIALSQLNRDGKSDQKSRAIDNGPEMENLRDSGQIEQDADVVFLIYEQSDQETGNPDPKKISLRSVRIAKNKEGERHKEIDFHFYGAKQQFRDIDDTR